MNCPNLLHASVLKRKIKGMEDLGTPERAELALETIEFVSMAMQAAAWSEDRCALSADVCRLGSRLLDEAVKIGSDGTDEFSSHS